MLVFCYSFFLPFFVMSFMFLVDEMKFMLISSRHFDVQQEILNSHDLLQAHRCHVTYSFA